MFNSIKTFNGINEVFDSINSDMNVIGDIFSCDWESSDIFDGAVKLVNQGIEIVRNLRSDDAETSTSESDVLFSQDPNSR